MYIQSVKKIHIHTHTHTHTHNIYMIIHIILSKEALINIDQKLNRF